VCDVRSPLPRAWPALAAPLAAVLTAAGILTWLTACGPGPAAAPGASPSSTPSSVVSTASTPARPAPVVVLNPGHNGGNATHPEEISRQVPAGGGRTKECDTTGTETNDGYPEHAFAWDVTLRVRDLLTARGITVVLTRSDDTSVGPCVDERAAIGNRPGVAAVVSIHADGSTTAGAHGFHVAYPAPALNTAQGAPSLGLAHDLRDALAGAGFATSNYLGAQGLDGRGDLAALSLSEHPTALVECGNMRDAAEAAVLSSPDGRQRYAEAIAAGTAAFVTQPS
jgi:N-acetylmuramoyl-L-alanine amidase